MNIVNFCLIFFAITFGAITPCEVSFNNGMLYIHESVAIRGKIIGYVDNPQWDPKVDPFTQPLDRKPAESEIFLHIEVLDFYTNKPQIAREIKVNLAGIDGRCRPIGLAKNGITRRYKVGEEVVIFTAKFEGDPNDILGVSTMSIFKNGTTDRPYFPPPENYNDVVYKNEVQLYKEKFGKDVWREEQFILLRLARFRKINTLFLADVPDDKIAILESVLKDFEIPEYYLKSLIEENFKDKKIRAKVLQQFIKKPAKGS